MSRTRKLLAETIGAAHLSSSGPQLVREMDDDYADGIGDHYVIEAPKAKIEEFQVPFEHPEWLARRGLSKILHGLDGQHCVETRVTHYAGNKFTTLGLREGGCNNPFQDELMSYYVMLESGRTVLVPKVFLKSISDQEARKLYPQGFPGYSKIS